MKKIVFFWLKTGNRCPQCGNGKVQRVKRRDWMRRLPLSKYYRCYACKARFLAVYRIGLSLPKHG